MSASKPSKALDCEEPAKSDSSILKLIVDFHVGEERRFYGCGLVWEQRPSVFVGRLTDLVAVGGGPALAIGSAQTIVGNFGSMTATEAALQALAEHLVQIHAPIHR